MQACACVGCICIFTNLFMMIVNAGTTYHPQGWHFGVHAGMSILSALCDGDCRDGVQFEREIRYGLSCIPFLGVQYALVSVSERGAQGMCSVVLSTHSGCITCCAHIRYDVGMYYRYYRHRFSALSMVSAYVQQGRCGLGKTHTIISVVILLYIH